MHGRGVFTLFSLVLSLLFALLVLLAEYRKGSLNHIAIATYSYSANSSIYYASRNDTPNYLQASSPVLTTQQLNDGLHWWIVSVHYLSICIGYVGGSPTPIVVIDSCQSRPGGWEFKSDDPFIRDFQRNGTLFPVEMFKEVETLKTAPSFVSLVLGVAFAILSIFALSAFQFNVGKQEISLGLITLTTLFLIISAACVSSMLSQSRKSVHTTDFDGWSTNLHGLSWASAAFAWVGLGLGVWELLRERREGRKRREELTFGQI
ncbi:hypothetical protein B0J14DRAFT_647657 [Halenospora varia]|nr:hypothetical protein B0J14DRAFT_647657 [Halenospora varia]